MISIEGLDRSAVLIALYNASQPVQTKALPAITDLSGKHGLILDTEDWDQKVRAAKLFNWIAGWISKDGTHVDEAPYDGQNGLGCAERALRALREGKPPPVTVYPKTVTTLGKSVIP